MYDSNLIIRKAKHCLCTYINDLFIYQTNLDLFMVSLVFMAFPGQPSNRNSCGFDISKVLKNTILGVYGAANCKLIMLESLPLMPVFVINVSAANYLPYYCLETEVIVLRIQLVILVMFIVVRIRFSKDLLTEEHSLLRSTLLETVTEEFQQAPM